MSTLQYVFLLLVMVTVALEAKKILRAQEGAPTTGRFLVSLDLDTPTERFEDLAKKIEVEAGNDIRKIYGRYAKIITAKLSENALEMIKDEANVKYIEEEIKLRASQDIPWHLDRIDQRDLPLDGSFTLGRTGAGVDIYILDTGIRFTHDDFGGRALYPGRDPVDDDSGSNQQGVDCTGHGTHVAALAGGNTYGVARGANLYSVRVLDCNGDGTVNTVIDGIQYAAQEITDSGRPGIISMSLGTEVPVIIQSIIDEVDAAVADGVPVIVAAGNENQDACRHTPSSALSAITVGSTTDTDARSWFSNWGACLDIFAPGSDITSASHLSDDGSTVKSGTSMATPLVSGVAATLLEQDNTLTPAQLAQQLIDLSTTDRVTDPQGSVNRLLYYSSVEPEVCWYQHSYYDGIEMCTTGLRGVDIEEINEYGLNDQFSSVKVPAGLQCVAFQHYRFSGEARLYTGDVNWVGDDFNDIISSYILSEPQVCFYQHSYYVGSVLCGDVGTTDYDIINGRGLNDQFSSVKVPAGRRVTAYEHAGCVGRSKVFSSDTNWVGNDFNDIISCFTVEEV